MPPIEPDRLRVPVTGGVTLSAIAHEPPAVRWFNPADHDIHAQHPDELAAVMMDALRDGSFAP